MNSCFTRRWLRLYRHSGHVFTGQTTAMTRRNWQLVITGATFVAKAFLMEKILHRIKWILASLIVCLFVWPSLFGG